MTLTILYLADYVYPFCYPFIFINENVFSTVHILKIKFLILNYIYLLNWNFYENYIKDYHVLLNFLSSFADCSPENKNKTKH